MFETRQYCIFSVSELDKVNFDEICETSVDTLRRSVDGTYTFVKWDGDIPAFIPTLTTATGAYTYSEMLAILNTPVWLPPVE